LKRLAAAGLACASLIGAATLRAETPPPAYVRGEQAGQGFLMTKLGKCFVITAAHVIGNEKDASVVGTGGVGVPGEASLLAEDPVADVAILQVSGPIASQCGSDYLKGVSEDVVGRQARAIVPWVNEEGKVVRDAYQTLVSNVETEKLSLSLLGEDSTHLARGLSGGMVSVEDHPAGMLLAINGNHGEVLRYDPLMDIVYRLLKTPLQRPAAELVVSREVNLAAAATGATLLNWSAPPVQPQWATSSLLRQPGPEFWKVSLAAGPVNIDIRLAGDVTQTITYVELRKGDASAEQLIRDYEVSTSVDGATWLLVLDRGEFSPGASSSSISFPPRLARYVRVRMIDSFDTSGKNGTLGRIVVR
jgi:F5/8 type C domain